MRSRTTSGVIDKGGVDGADAEDEFLEGMVNRGPVLDELNSISRASVNEFVQGLDSFFLAWTCLQNLRIGYL
jgi:hypothetical protein